MNRFVLLLVTAPFALAAVPACSSSSPATPAGDDDHVVDDDADHVDDDADGGTKTTADADPGTPADDMQCSAARKTHLVPIAKVSTGEVKVLSNADGVTTLYVDAAAGGAMEASKNPRVYITLTGSRVELNDEESFTSPGWDLALKRVDIFTNSGDAGVGKGGAAKIAKDFDDVTAADADAAEIESEKFFDKDCIGRKDQADFIITTFEGWYNYQVGGGPTVKPDVTFIVRAANGTDRYKLGIVSYTGKSDGSTDGQVTGRYILKIASL